MTIYIKIVFNVVFVFCFVTGCASTKTGLLSAPTDTDENKTTIESICEEIVNTPEENINLGRYAMLMTKTVSPNMLFEHEMGKLDKMANDIRPRLNGLTDPQKIVSTLNKYFFEELQFGGMLRPDDEPNYYLIHYALWRKRAQCVTIGVIYLCLAERLNLPIYGVRVPRHFFVRYDDGVTKINIDTTYKKGENISDAEYIKEFSPEIKESDAGKWSFLRNMTKKEVLAEYIVSTLAESMIRGPSVNNKHALRYIDCAIKIGPTLCNAYSMRGGAYSGIGLGEKDSDIDLNILRESESSLLKAYDLYPYDLPTIVLLIIVYHYLQDYENCLKRIDELLAKFSIDKISTEIPIKDLKYLKNECMEKLESGTDH